MKVGDKVICKKDYISILLSDKTPIFKKNQICTIIKIDKSIFGGLYYTNSDFVDLENDETFDYYSFVTSDYTPYENSSRDMSGESPNFHEHFYTVEECRRLKLKTII